MVGLRSGHFWQTVWEHSENAELVALRKDPLVLKPGDVLVIPPVREKIESVSTGKTHYFRRRGVPSRLRLRLYEDGVARANLPFVLEVRGAPSVRGTTDGDGVVDVFYDAASPIGLLWVGEDREPYFLRVGWLRPTDGLEGVQQRLMNLGYACPPPKNNEMLSRMKHAVRLFQADYGLTPTGELDDATRARLLEAHDRTFVEVPEGTAR